MKFTLNWLKEYLDTHATLEQVSEKLTALGLEVEGITDRAEIYKGFVIAHVAEADQHPNADRLKQCLVNTGTEQLQVVCGAPNVRKGLRVVFALPGTTIPSSGLVLKKSSIRGVDSNGMICSDAELNLSEESNGIRELPNDAPIGMDFAKYMGFDDPVIEINLTPNRADAAGIYGIARDLAAAGLGKLKPIASQPVPGGFASPVKVTIDAPKACPLFMGRYIRGVKNGPSPKWLQDYLTAIGSRSISALVDITNFMCIGMNRPLHVFDADKLHGDLVVRLAKPGENFTDLKENTRELNECTIVVADKNGPQAMGGVIGGLDSGCTSDTVNVFLEAAYFDPSFIRRTGQEFGIDSDAKYRFERGIDPAFTSAGIEIATRMILDACGGEPSHVVVAGNEPNWQRHIQYDPKTVKNLGGMDVSTPEQMDILTALGFEISDRNDGLLDVIPPSWRNDVDGAADLVEEVLRLKSYDAIPEISIHSAQAVPKPALTLDQKRVADLRRLCAIRGLSEAVTWSFLSQRAHDAFSYGDRKTARLANPISSDLSIMRHAQLPNLLDAAKRNADRKLDNAALFEIGSVFFGTGPNDQPLVLSGLRTGFRHAANWQEKGRAVDFFDAKEDVWALLAQAGLNPDALTVSAEAPSWYHPGQSGVVRLGKNIVAQFGVLHPRILGDWDLSSSAAAFEIFVDQLPGLKPKKSATKASLVLNALQPVTRDFAFVAANTLASDQILKAIRNADKTLITGVTLFDVYAGKGVADGHRSLAFTVTLQPQGATLTDAVIEGVSGQIVAAVEKLGGQLRG